MKVTFMRLKGEIVAAKAFSIYINEKKEMSILNGETKSLEIKKGSTVRIHVNRFMKDSSFNVFEDKDIIVIMQVKPALVSKRSLSLIIIEDGSLISITN